MTGFREHRRNHFAEEHLMTDYLWQAAASDLSFLAGLTDEELLELRKLATIFSHEMIFEGGDGMELTEEMCAVISVQASLPVLKLGMNWYSSWNTVVVVPDHIISKRVSTDRAGVVSEWVEVDAGESWHKGPVVYAWPDVIISGRRDGFNVVIHEAAHRLDMTDGSVNGRPALHKGMDLKRWTEVCTSAFNDLTARSGPRRRTQIDGYATVSDAEFFAVMTEYFFELPHVMLREYPELYELFRDFYRQDPVTRLPSHTFAPQLRRM